MLEDRIKRSKGEDTIFICMHPRKISTIGLADRVIYYMSLMHILGKMDPSGPIVQLAY